VFKEYKSTQKLYQNTTQKSWEELNNLRVKGDAIILDLWNQVEQKYKDEKPFARLTKCQQLGLIYYYRKGENELTIDDDLK
jgi:hypothetical protein